MTSPPVYGRDYVPVAVLFSRYQTWYHCAAGDIPNYPGPYFICACVACACDVASHTKTRDMAGERGGGGIVFRSQMM